MLPPLSPSPSDLALPVRGGHVRGSTVPPGVTLRDAVGGEEEGGVGEVGILLGALGKDRRTLLGDRGQTAAHGRGKGSVSWAVSFSG